MAAGLGFKDFTTGEVLTAADVDGYLMQGIWVFASTAARNAAVTSPQEGNFAFTKDTNSLWYYDGAAWVASGATGDIEGVTAGIGISGGGTSGTVTVTNSMATAIDAKGDLVVGTGADTFDKLTVGANDTILTADSTTATGLKWAAAAGGGGMTLINSGGTTLTGASVTISSIPGTYQHLQLIIRNPRPDVDSEVRIRFNGDSTTNYGVTTSNDAAQITNNVTAIYGGDTQDSATATGLCVFDIFDYANTVTRKTVVCTNSLNNATTPTDFAMARYFLYWNSNNAITSITIIAPRGNWTSGTAYLYGVK